MSSSSTKPSMPHCFLFGKVGDFSNAHPRVFLFSPCAFFPLLLFFFDGVVCSCFSGRLFRCCE